MHLSRSNRRPQGTEGVVMGIIPFDTDGINLSEFDHLIRRELIEKIEAQQRLIESQVTEIAEHIKLESEMALLNKELAVALVESRNNDRTAMAYLHEVQATVLSHDFPEMVQRVKKYKALCDQMARKEKA